MLNKKAIGILRFGKKIIDSTLTTEYNTVVDHEAYKNRRIPADDNRLESCQSKCSIRRGSLMSKQSISALFANQCGVEN